MSFLIQRPGCLEPFVLKPVRAERLELFETPLALHRCVAPLKIRDQERVTEILGGWLSEYFGASFFVLARLFHARIERKVPFECSVGLLVQCSCVYDL